jgi:hypothetical protein
MSTSPFQSVTGAGHHVYADRADVFNKMVNDTCTLSDEKLDIVTTKAVKPPKEPQEPEEEVKEEEERKKEEEKKKEEDGQHQQDKVT